MPGYFEDGGAQSDADFTILKQKVDLDLDFARCALRGSTEITLQPLSKDLKHVRLHCRQCRPLSVQAGGITAKFAHKDPYRRLRMPPGADIHAHDMLREKIEASLAPTPAPELDITLPPKLKLQELQLDPLSALPQPIATPSLQKQESDAMALLETPTALAAQGPQFAPIKIEIEFEVQDIRDGLHWIGFESEDSRYPYVYTKGGPFPGNTSCIFPCLDDSTTRCSWEISIRAPRTLGDAFRRPKAGDDLDTENGTKSEYLIDLSDEDASLELAILCIGDVIEDVADSDDASRHTVSFNLIPAVAARHVGFAIGPFETIDLGASREAEDEEKLGQSAVKILGHCLPSRSDELRNTAMPVHVAIDYLAVNYGSYPFATYQMLFLDELVHDTVALAGITLCSSRLLFGEDVIEPITQNTRIIIRAIAEQWMGVNVIAKEPRDAWIIAGIAGFMSDLFGKKLFGNNEYRWAQKLASEEIYTLDADRPSIHELGALLHLDSSIKHFLDLKSALVLFILDRRLIKASSSTGIARVISKIFMNAKTGSLVNGELSTADFQKTCERLGHNKLDPFFRQWVFGAGCPIFEIRQRFNKKKLVVEMTISQRQIERRTKPEFAPNIFMREIKEHVQEIWAPEVQPVFTGPMTIRIHEADGTPYEHIVEIKEQVTKLEIPYNTKYKRLKRSRRQRERAIASGVNNDNAGEGGDDALLYCLGDILDSTQEVDDWNLKDWTPEDEEKMGGESYEWIRIDADFEWIGRFHLWLPVYMYVSQLQQDRDLAAQYDSIKYVENCGPNHVGISVLLRTLMDRRYFHGIRTMAANAIANISKGAMQEVGQKQLEKAFAESFCFPNSIMPRPNDWSSRVNYIMQCAIPLAMSKLRDADGRVPIGIRRFFVDKLKFNDNSDNPYSDAHYIATLMQCLADSLAVSHREVQPSYAFEFGAVDDEPMEVENPDAEFETEAVGEIERYRRIDEWISTYHNVYSVTALQCLRKLTKAGIAKDKTRELLIYTRRTNADDVRLAAYDCLNQTGVTSQAGMLRYLLHELADDFSPYFRNRLLRILGQALGHIALGDGEEQKPVQPQAEDGLVIEQEVSEEVRQAIAIRKSTPDGALKALRDILGEGAKFQEALWYAIASPIVTIDEVAELIDIASLLYDARTSYLVTFRMPRKYRATRVKEALVKFTPFGGPRTAPSRPLAKPDWQNLQKYKLKYSGPLSKEVQLDEEKSLKSQIEALKQRKAQEEAKAAEATMPPPPPLLHTNTERTGVRLSLGGAKRKQSSSAAPREESAKAPKIKLGQSPVEAASSKPSPAPPTEKKTTGSLAAAHMRKTGAQTMHVSFKLTSAAQERAAAILAAPSKRAETARPRSRQTSHTPNSTHDNLTVQSPSQYSQSPTQELTPMNLGGFRSFGQAPALSLSASKSQSPEVKREVSDLPSTLDTGVIMRSPTVMSPEGILTPVEAAPVANLSAPSVQHDTGLAPPKKKFTLKLGKRPPQPETNM